MIQIIFKCCESEIYLIVLLPNYKRMYDQIDQIENKLELFIANWSYSYYLKRVFVTYQRMRANRKSLAGTRHNANGTSTAQIPRKDIHFVRSHCGLYYQDCSPGNRAVTMVQIVGDNAEGFTNRKVAAARRS